MTGVLDAHVHLWELVAHPQPWTEPVCLLAADYTAAQATMAGVLDRVDALARQEMRAGTVCRWYLGQVA